MSNLDRANAAKRDKTLDKLWKFDDRTESYRQRIDRGVYARAEVRQEPSVSYNRAAYNRMSAEQQDEHDRKRAITKPAYYLIRADNERTRQEVTKTVFDYFNATRPAPAPAATTADPATAYQTAVNALNRAYVTPNSDQLDIVGMEACVSIAQARLAHARDLESRPRKTNGEPRKTWEELGNLMKLVWSYRARLRTR